MDSFRKHLFSNSLSRRDWLRSGGLLGLSGLFGAAIAVMYATALLV